MNNSMASELQARIQEGFQDAKLAVRVLLVLAVLASLGGCAAAVVGAGTTGVAVAHDSRTAGSVVEDQAIELKFTSAMLENQELNGQVHINVTSYNQIVLVSGEAPTEYLRNQVIDVVRRIDKVRHVYDEITIAAPSSLLTRSSDSVTTAKVKTRLITLENFDGTRVKVVTENGVVFLMGLLTREEANKVAEAARSVGGVQKVVKLFEYPA